MATCREFARSVLGRMLPYVDNADMEGSWPEEIALYVFLAETVRDGSFEIAKIEKALGRLTELSQQDEVHAIETDGDITDFLCALDELVALEEGIGDSKSAAAVSEQMMNILDSHFTPHASDHVWLTTPEIKEEFEKQLEFLRQRN